MPLHDMALAADERLTDDDGRPLEPPRLLHRRPRPASLSLALRFSVPMLLLAIWFGTTNAGLVTPDALASPQATVREAVELWSSGVIQTHLIVSLSRAATGLLLGGTAGILLGLTAGLSSAGEELIDPTVQMIRALPFLALIPLFIVWFGIGESSKILLIATAAAKPLYLAAYSGVRSVDAKLVEAGRVFGLSRYREIVEIYLPAALPSLMVGLRLAMTLSLIALIAVEAINTSRGLGFLMLQAQEFFKTDTLVVCIVIYAVFGILSDLSVRALEAVLMPWRRGRPA